MEKTYKRVPFDIELAKKIQASEIKGKTEPQFKPFDKVLVRLEGGIWTANLFSHYTNLHNLPYAALNGHWMQCIPYEGNEYLLGTNDKPKED